MCKSPLSVFSTNNLLAFLVSPKHATHSIHLFHFDNLDGGYEGYTLPIHNFLHIPLPASAVFLNILFSTFSLNTVNTRFSLCVRDQSSQPYKKTGKTIVLYFGKREDTGF
jgi:uncharacterized membrane-anchored protein YitT (DUF2179 family)